LVAVISIYLQSCNCKKFKHILRRERYLRYGNLNDFMNKFVAMPVLLALSLGIGFAYTGSVSGQDTGMANESMMNQTNNETLSGLESDLGNDTQILENDTDIGNPNNDVLNSMATNENQSN
jgi:hypothetical protein